MNAKHSVELKLNWYSFDHIYCQYITIISVHKCYDTDLILDHI